MEPRYDGTSTRGFTLVEIIVVLAIISVIVTVVTGGFGNYALRQSYNSIVSEVRDDLEEVRRKTLGSVGDTIYGVYVGTTTIEFFSGTTTTPGAAGNTIIALPGTITATSSFADGNQYVTFARLTGEPSATGTITIEDTGGNASTTLTITGSGLVE